MNIWISHTRHPGIAPAENLLRGSHAVTVGEDSLDLRDPDAVEPCLAGVDAIVHPAVISGRGQSDEDILDHASRGAYAILDAAVRAGVRRAVLISTLSLFDDYPDSYVIEESWQPRPGADALSLAPRMAEIVFREYARQGPIETVCLRFGEIDADDGTPGSLAADAIQAACSKTLSPGAYRWQVYHVADSSRFRMSTARSALGLEEEN